MLWSARGITGYEMAATDGVMGRVSDVVFDDRAWRVRAMAVTIDQWSPHRTVLIDPIFLRRPDPQARVVPVAMTRQQVYESALRRETATRRVQGLYEREPSCHWNSRGVMLVAEPWFATARQQVDELPALLDADRHAQTVERVCGFRVMGDDGPAGFAADFVLDVLHWRIRQIVVDLGRLLPGPRVLVGTESIDDIDRRRMAVNAHLTRSQVRQCPSVNRAKMRNMDDLATVDQQSVA